LEKIPRLSAQQKNHKALLVVILPEITIFDIKAATTINPIPLFAPHEENIAINF